MRKHWLYLKYVIRHKWYVFVACAGYALFRIDRKPLLALRLLLRGIVHDWTKFLPSEWFPYAEYFYGNKRQSEWFELTSLYGIAEAAPWGVGIHDKFCIAWNFHQKRNDHHYQYWYLTEDSGQSFSVGIPEICRYEMICDWIGAGRAMGKPKVWEWFDANYTRMKLRDTDLVWVETEMTRLREMHEMDEKARGIGLI